MLAQCNSGHSPVEIGENFSVLDHLKCATCGSPLVAQHNIKAIMTTEQFDKTVGPAIIQAGLDGRRDFDQVLKSSEYTGGKETDPIMNIWTMASNYLFLSFVTERLRALLTGAPYRDPKTVPKGTYVSSETSLTIDTPIPKL